MKQKLHLIVLGQIIAVLIIMHISVYAETTAQIDCDLQTQQFTASGNITGAEYNHMVSIAVFDASNDMVYTSFEDVDADGGFSFKFRLSESLPSGKYTLKLGAYDNDSAFSKEFEYVNEIERLNAMKKVNDAINKGALATALKDSANILNLNMVTSTKMSAQGMDTIYQNLFDILPIVNAADLYQKYYSQYAVVALNESNVNNVSGIIKEFEAFYGFKNRSIYNDYVSLGEKATRADRRFINKGLKSINDAGILFDQNVVLASFDVVSWGEIDLVIKKYSSIILFSLEQYNKSDKYKMAQVLIGDKFENMSALQTAIKNEYLRQLASDEKSGSGGSSGGSGGNVKSDITVGSNPIIPPVVTPTTEIEVIPEWAKENIDYLLKSGIITGDDHGSIRPSDNITREEFVKILVTGCGVFSESAQSNFGDVVASHWAYPYVSCASQMGIVTGKDNNLFGLGEFITRGDIAVMSVRMFDSINVKLKDIADEKIFVDDNLISSYAAKSIKTIQKAGIINGYEDNSFCPQNNATRAEAFKIVYKLMREVEQK